jgi:PleD family two-component response regulator
MAYEGSSVIRGKETDNLTGLFNPGGKLSEVLASLRRRVPTLRRDMLVIEDFKKSTTGRPARGDACLKMTVNGLNRIGGERNMVAYRYGGRNSCSSSMKGGRILFSLANWC